MNAVPATPWPLHIFAFLLFPMACWQLWLFPGIPNYYAQHFLIYPSLVFMLWAWKRGLWTLAEAWRLARPFFPWLLLLVILQIVADWRSARFFLPEGAPMWRSIATSLIKLGAQLPFILFFILLWRVLLREEASRRAMLQGAVWSFGFLAFWCTVQAAYVYTVATPFYPEQESGSATILAVRKLLRVILENVSPWLEARWPKTIYEFYGKGAYALTLTRFNGFFEEASALSAMVGVFFVPLGFGLLGLASYKRKFQVVGTVILVASLGIMIFCRSGTGQILSIVTLLLIVLFCLRGRFKLFKIFAGAALVVTCTYAALYAPHVDSYSAYRAQVFELSRTPRIIVTLDTLDMIKAYPLLGVGRNWYFVHLHSGRRYLANLSDPELRVWKDWGSGGELSALPALAAQYGLPLIILALIFVGHIWWRLQTLHRACPANPLLAFMAPACTVWLVLGLAASLGALDIRNPLFCLPFFCFYAISQGIGLEDIEEAGEV